MLSDNIINALVTFFSAILSAVIIIVGYIYTRKNHHRQIYADNVSKTRNVWLDSLRESISKMLAEVDSKLFGNTVSDSVEYYRYRNDIITRLNMSEYNHVLLYTLILKLDNCNKKNYEKIRDKILEVTQEIIKEEWEKVKKEAQGGMSMASDRGIKSYNTILYIVVGYIFLVFVSFFLIVLFYGEEEFGFYLPLIIVTIVTSLLITGVISVYIFKVLKVHLRKELCQQKRYFEIDDIKQAIKDLEK